MVSDAEQLVVSARSQAIEALVGPGDWLTGAQRAAVWAESRAADHHPVDRDRRAALSPAAVEERHEATADLPAAAVDVVHRVATDPGRLTRAWASGAIDELGVEVYTELVGVTAVARVIDTFSLAVGEDPVEPGEPVAGEPDRRRADDVGEVGAWVPQSLDKTRANVSRALSLLPRTNGTWRTLVDSHYSRGRQFMELQWSRALSRVQVEAVAARTTSALDCFY
jgi:hypothetical protein